MPKEVIKEARMWPIDLERWRDQPLQRSSEAKKINDLTAPIMTSCPQRYTTTNRRDIAVV